MECDRAQSPPGRLTITQPTRCPAHAHQVQTPAHARHSAKEMHDTWRFRPFIGATSFRVDSRSRSRQGLYFADLLLGAFGHKPLRKNILATSKTTVELRSTREHGIIYSYNTIVLGHNYSVYPLFTILHTFFVSVCLSTL